VPDTDFPIYLSQSSKVSSTAGIAVREDAAYTNAKGEEKDAIRKRTEKTIEKLQEPIRQFLEPGEAIFLVTKAQLPVSQLEALFLGWLAGFSDVGWLVLTNRRLLFFLVNWKGLWSRSVRSVALGDIEKATIKTFPGTSRLLLQYRSGVQEYYWQIQMEDAKRLKAMLDLLLAASTSERTDANGRVHLCPQCKGVLIPGEYQCPKCHIEFKNEKDMTRRGWMLPGMGYFYIGHRGLGILDVIIDTCLLIYILEWTLDGLGLFQPDAGPGQTGATPNEAWVLAGILAAIWIFKRLLSIRHCRHFVQEFIPVK
jgi:hypothetical protein